MNIAVCSAAARQGGSVLLVVASLFDHADSDDGFAPDSSCSRESIFRDEAWLICTNGECTGEFGSRISQNNSD